MSKVNPLTGARVNDLLATWRGRAAGLRRYAPEVAIAFEEAASELESAAAKDREVVVTLEQASTYSGYSRDHLRRLLRDGALHNVGRPHAPRLVQGELPIKPRRFAGPEEDGYDPVADARQVAAVRNRGGER